MMSLWAIFLTGLFTGGLSCLAVQGGLLAATLAQQEEEKLKEKTKRTGNAVPIIAFLVSKLSAYTLFGFLLGWFGSLFQLSLTVQILMQLAVVIFMLGTAGDILHIHPIFRYFVIQPPHFMTKLIRNQSKSNSIFAPSLLGALTVFIPCGTTQAMMALAIGSAHPLMGAMILFTFVLGTSPLFFILGYFTTRLGENLHQKFMQIAAITLVLLALYNLNNVLALTGSSFTIEKVLQRSQARSSNPNSDTVTISILQTGYNPNEITVKAGEKVRLAITNKDSYTCASAFTIPYFRYQEVVPAGKTELIELQMPDVPTQIPFMCSMGMYRGVINVVL